MERVADAEKDGEREVAMDAEGEPEVEGERVVTAEPLRVARTDAVFEVVAVLVFDTVDEGECDSGLEAEREGEEDADRDARVVLDARGEEDALPQPVTETDAVADVLSVGDADTEEELESVESKLVDGEAVSELLTLALGDPDDDTVPLEELEELFVTDDDPVAVEELEELFVVVPDVVCVGDGVGLGVFVRDRVPESEGVAVPDMVKVDEVVGEAPCDSDAVGEPDREGVRDGDLVRVVERDFVPLNVCVREGVTCKRRGLTPLASRRVSASHTATGSPLRAAAAAAAGERARLPGREPEKDRVPEGVPEGVPDGLAVSRKRRGQSLPAGSVLRPVSEPQAAAAATPRAAVGAADAPGDSEAVDAARTSPTRKGGSNAAVANNKELLAERIPSKSAKAGGNNRIAETNGLFPQLRSDSSLIRLIRLTDQTHRLPGSTYRSIIQVFHAATAACKTCTCGGQMLCVK